MSTDLDAIAWIPEGAPRQSFYRYSFGLTNDLLKHIQKGLGFHDLWENIWRVPEYGAAFMGGKHLRGSLLMLVYDALAPVYLKDYPQLTRENALDLAAAIEISHSASLIVDDMIDDDTTRRGKAAHHVTVGEKRAMLDTVDALGAAYHLAGTAGFKYTLQLSDTQRQMCSGVIREALKQHKVTATSLYELLITQKTGNPFALAAQWGATVANAPEEIIKDFREYGLYTGLAMQMADDIADLSRIGAKGKKKGFGSEVLLLRCLTVDGLVKEMVADLKTLHPHPSNIKYFMSQKGIVRQLDEMLKGKVQMAEYVIANHYKKAAQPFGRILLETPAEIVQMMKDEK